MDILQKSVVLYQIKLLFLQALHGLARKYKTIKLIKNNQKGHKKAF